MIYLHFKWGGGYTKSEVDTLLNGKSDTGHTHTVSDVTDFPTLSTVATSGDYDDLSNKPTIPVVDSALSSTSTNTLQNKVINTELSKKANTSHTHTVSDVTDFPSLATVATSGSYNDLTNKPTTMTPASHTHGNITNDGKIGSNANKPLITTTGGTVTTGSFGTSANTFCEGNDSRLSDARTPTAHTHSASDITSGLATVATSGSYNDLSNKPTIPTVNNATLTIQKNGTTVKTFTANASSNVTANITVPTKTSDLTNDNKYTSCLNSSNDIKFDWNSTYSNKVGIKVDNTWLGGILTTANTTIPTKTSQLTNDSGFLTSHQSLSSRVPVAGGAVMSGGELARTVDNLAFYICGGTTWTNCGSVLLHGGGRGDYLTGAVVIHTFRDVTAKNMHIYPDGTWTWEGQPCQITSDQRLKQQIAEIDDKLLDAWEDVELSQFKYNDAVKLKSDNARLHTGYVVQQIDEACKKHNVDISAYGLYCHEEYPQETEEVEVEQADGTKVKERKVIREASEHYSLRYTETLVVECAYLRRENARLKQQMQQYTESLSKLEERLKALEQTSK